MSCVQDKGQPCTPVGDKCSLLTMPGQALILGATICNSAMLGYEQNVGTFTIPACNEISLLVMYDFRREFRVIRPDPASHPGLGNS